MAPKVVAIITGQNGRWPVPTKVPAPTKTTVDGTNRPMISNASPKAMRKMITMAQPGWLEK